MNSEQLESIVANPYKQDFPLLEANPDLAFLDSAATAQRPTCVLDAAFLLRNDECQRPARFVPFVG